MKNCPGDLMTKGFVVADLGFKNHVNEYTPQKSMDLWFQVEDALVICP